MLLAARRDIGCDRANEILKCSWAGRKWSRKHGRTKVFLVCLVAELRKKRGGGVVKVENRKRKKERKTGRKVKTLNKNFIKFSEWFL